MKFVSKEPINKGWSNDRKFCVTDEKGMRFLLRISDIQYYDEKRAEFGMMKQVAALGVPMCLPIELGTCEEGVYSVQSWIDGEDAEQVIPVCSHDKGYFIRLELAPYTGNCCVEGVLE